MSLRAKVNYIDPETFEIIVSNIPRLNIRKWTNVDVEFLFRVTYWCGLRMSEAVKLKKEDFDLMRCEVYLGKTKKAKNDYAPIPEPFIPQLNQFLAMKEVGRLWPKLTARHVRQQWVNKLGEMLNIPAWTTSQQESGEKTKTHIFRKSIGKDMLYGTHGKKAPLNVVQKQLRHSDISTTSKYLQVGIEDVKDWWVS